MPLDAAALGSVSSSLDTLVERLRTLSADAQEDEDVVTELLEVERQLHTASRRLAKALRRL